MVMERNRSSRGAVLLLLYLLHSQVRLYRVYGSPQAAVIHVRVAGMSRISGCQTAVQALYSKLSQQKDQSLILSCQKLLYNTEQHTLEVW